MNVTFDSNKVRRFFQGLSDEAPVEEMKYIVDKQCTFSFLDEVNSKIELAARKAEVKKIRTYSAVTLKHRFHDFKVLLVNGIKEKNDEKIAEALKVLREIYATAEGVCSI